MTSDNSDDKKPKLSVIQTALSDAPEHHSDNDLEPGVNDEAIQMRISQLEEEHRDLDAAITSLEQNSPYERLTIARLKKKKLQLKDAIQEIKDAMLPDIIA